MRYKSGTEIQGCVQRAEPGVLFHLLGSIQWPDGSRYDGTLKDSRSDGHGCCVWVNGNTYCGGWKQGVQEGYGKVNALKSSICKMPGPNGGVLAHSAEYEGEWSKNAMHGKGTLRYFDAPDYGHSAVIEGLHERRGRLLRSFTGFFKHGYAIKGELQTQHGTYKEVSFEEKTTCGEFAAWYWTTTKGREEAHDTTTLRELKSEEEEYQAVAYRMQWLEKTCGVKIQRIQRVQNYKMRALFELEREASEARAPGRAGEAAQWAFYAVVSESNGVVCVMCS